MKNFIPIYLIMFGTFITSCNKDNILEITKVSQKTLHSNFSSFSTSIPIEMESDYLIFKSFNDLDSFINQANYTSPEALNLWESNIGFCSQRKYFYNIIAAEDSLDEHLENLSEQDQLIEKAKTPYHTTIHDNALNVGLIRYYGEGENTYWDYSIVDPLLASVVNLNGIVKVGGQLIKYSNNNFIYIIKDGDLSKLPLAELKSENYEDDFIKVIKTTPFNPENTVNNYAFNINGLCYSIPHEITFSKSNPWHQKGKYRLRVQIDGRANANFGSSECVHGTTCTFQVRAQAQRKNFWGNWVYSSKFVPAFEIKNAYWSYYMSLMPTCSDLPTLYSNNISGGKYPKPIYSHFWPSINNAFLPFHPSTTGWWVWDDKKICTTINLSSYNIPVIFNGDSSWDLVK